MTDPLALFWRHTVSIARRSGSGGYGDGYGPAEDVVGFVHDGSKLTMSPEGAQIVSSAQVALPAGIAYVPPGSMVTLPAVFGGRSARVIATDVGDGGGLPTPDHHELILE